jgi:hypothetical protein
MSPERFSRPVDLPQRPAAIHAGPWPSSLPKPTRRNRLEPAHGRQHARHAPRPGPLFPNPKNLRRRHRDHGNQVNVTRILRRAFTLARYAGREQGEGSFASSHNFRFAPRGAFSRNTPEKNMRRERLSLNSPLRQQLCPIHPGFGPKKPTQTDMKTTETDTQSTQTDQNRPRRFRRRWSMENRGSRRRFRTEFLRPSPPSILDLLSPILSSRPHSAHRPQPTADCHPYSLFKEQKITAHYTPAAPTFPR